MSKKSKILLLSVLSLGIVALIAYGFLSSRELDKRKEKTVSSNIKNYLYDESKDTLEDPERDVEDLDGDAVQDEDDDFEVYEEPEPEEEALPVASEPPSEKPFPESTSKPKTPLEDSHYVIIVGSFKNEANANRKLKSLQKIGMEGDIIQLKGSSLRTVIAGRFPTKSEAEKIAQQLKAKEFKAVIMKITP